MAHWSPPPSWHHPSCKQGEAISGDLASHLADVRQSARNGAASASKTLLAGRPTFAHPAYQARRNQKVLGM